MKSICRFVGPMVVVLTLGTFTYPAFGQPVFTWTGAGANDNFSNATNWAGVVNGNIFGVQTFTGNTRLTPFADTALSTHRFIFTNAGSFTISGSRITFFDNSGTDPVIRNNSTNVQTINNEIRGDDTINDDPLRLDANLGDLVFNGNITNRGSTLVIVGGSDSRYVAIGGMIHGGSNVNVNIDSGTMRILDSGNIDNISGAMGVGSSSTTNTNAKLFIADMDGGKVINKAISINQGNGASGNRELGGLNTSGINTFAGNINRSATGNKTVTLSAAAGGTVDFNGNILGDHGVIVRGPGTVRFGGVNTYAAFTSIESGELHLKQGATLSGAGQTVFLGNGTTPGVAAGLMISDADGGTAIGQNISVNQGLNANRRIGGLNSSGTNSFNGTVTLGGVDRRATLHAEDGGTVAFNNPISGLGGINKSGGGTVQMNAHNPYFGNTIVDEGVLKIGTGGSISNSAVIDVKSGATLDVTEAVDFGVQDDQTLTGGGMVAGNVAFKSGSILAPGESPGKIIFDSFVTLDAGSIFQIELAGYTAGIDYDQVEMINASVFNVNNATLNVSFLGGFELTVTENTVFTIVSGQNSGTFDGLNEGDIITQDGRELRLSYNGGNDITLTVVPEPASLILMGLGLACMRYRKKLAGRHEDIR